MFPGVVPLFDGGARVPGCLPQFPGGGKRNGGPTQGPAGSAARGQRVPSAASGRMTGVPPRMGRYRDRYERQHNPRYFIAIAVDGGNQRGKDRANLSPGQPLASLGPVRSPDGRTAAWGPGWRRPESPPVSARPPPSSPRCRRTVAGIGCEGARRRRLPTGRDWLERHAATDGSPIR